MLKKAILFSLFASTVAFAKISVAVGIFPIYDAVKSVAKDKANIVLLVPFGVEAHDFEPKAKSVAELSKSDVFLSSGEVFEPWSTKVVASLKIKDKTVDLSKKVKLIKAKQETHGHHEHEHEHGAYDPHYWLSIDNYIAITKEIAAVLSKKDPQNAKWYADNASAHISKLTELKKEYSTLKTCKNKKIIVNHDAFGYLASDYGIVQYPIAGLSPDAQPTPKQIAKLIGIVKKEKISTVFFEEFASDKVAKTIAKESGAKTDTLRPIENITQEEGKQNIGYIDIMKANFLKLKGAMNCN